MTTTTRLSMTGSTPGLTTIYVDPKAASSLADGSAQNPFKTVEDALELAPELVDDFSLEDDAAFYLRNLRTIEICGMITEVIVDRPCVLQGPGIIGTLTIVSPIVFVYDLTIGTLEIESEYTQVQGCDVDEASIENSQVRFQNCVVLEMELGGDEGGSLNLANFVMLEAVLDVPADWDVLVVNGVIGGLDGTTGNVTAVNSDVDAGT